MLKYVVAASGGINIALAIALYLTSGSLSDARTKLGESKIAAAHNEETAGDLLLLYNKCDADRVQMVKDNNQFVSEIVNSDADRVEALRKLTVENRVRTQKIMDGLADLGKTPVGDSCQQRLEIIEAQLDSYRELVNEE